MFQKGGLNSMQKREKTYTIEELEKMKIPIGRAKNLINHRFGKLIVLFRVKSENHQTAWACKCDCSNYCICITQDLEHGYKTSCAKCKEKRKNVIHWDLDSMNKYCKDNNINYQVLELKREKSKNGNQRLYSLLKCPNDNHEPYWTQWCLFVSGQRCKQCVCEKRGITLWNKETAYDYYMSNGLIMINKNDFRDVHTAVRCFDENNFIHTVSINSLN